MGMVVLAFNLALFSQKQKGFSEFKTNMVLVLRDTQEASQ